VVRVVVSRSHYELLSDAQLKREVDDLVFAFSTASPEVQEALLRDAEELRDVVAERLRRRGDGEWEQAGVREPRRPRPGGSAAAAAAEPEGNDG
jgi:hypothetical protein